MDARSIELNELAQNLRSSNDEAFLRVMAVRSADVWVLHSASVLVGSEPPNWSEAVWRYEDAVFVATSTAAADLAVLCAGTGTITLAGVSIQIPAVNGPAHGGRRPSFSRHDRPLLPFPVTDYSISPQDGGRSLPPGIQAGADDAPSFPDLEKAWQAFFEDDFTLRSSYRMPSHLVLFRLADKDAWIGSVHVSATELTVTVEGTFSDKVDVELFGRSGRNVLQVDGPGEVTFPLLRGLPGEAWLWLKRDTRWLDYRSLDPASAWAADLDQAGVEFEAPVEPLARVEALIASGEGPHVEFKEFIPDSRGDRRNLKTVAAFATGDGGAIIFGINRDEVTITGVAEDSVVRQRDNLVNLIRGTVTPMPEVTVKDYEVEGKRILVLDVEPGQSPPYGLTSPATRDKPEYFVRRGANTYPAQPSDVREAVLSRMQPPTPNR